MTQESFAFLCGLDTSTIERYENCKRRPNIDTLDKIAKAIGITASKLIDFTE